MKLSENRKDRMKGENRGQSDKRPRKRHNKNYAPVAN